MDAGLGQLQGISKIKLSDRNYCKILRKFVEGEATKEIRHGLHKGLWPLRRHSRDNELDIIIIGFANAFTVPSWVILAIIKICNNSVISSRLHSDQKLWTKIVNQITGALKVHYHRREVHILQNGITGHVGGEFRT